MVIPARCCCRSTPCVGCQCDEASQVQLTSTWTNHVCNGCTSLNTIIVPKVSAFPYIGNGDTCLTYCDDGCMVGNRCFYYLHLEPDCTPPDLIPYLFCGGGCEESFPCTIEDNCSSGGSPICGTIGTGILPADYNFLYGRNCGATCSSGVSCIDGECVGGYGGTLSDCNPMLFHCRVSIWQAADKSKTAVNVSFVIDGAGLFARAGCGVFDGPCSELDLDVDLDYECLTGISLNGCIMPTTVNVQVI